VLDLAPATNMLAELVGGVRDDQLTDPTPCADTSVAALLDHLDGMPYAFALAARKQEPPGGSQPPVANADHLTPDWRTRIPARLEQLADAWRDPEAWSGSTNVGGIDLPGHVAGLVAINELVVHGWDLAVATAQRYQPDEDLVRAALEFVRPTVAQNPAGTPGLFGPPVSTTEGATVLDTLIALTGRDPSRSSASE
jgi:uncharacterized protein (TIGR03086 family)